jgi:hypothetical protein
VYTGPCPQWEEVQLVVEEMQRTLVFFEWLACEWERRATVPLMDSSKVDSAASEVDSTASEVDDTASDVDSMVLEVDSTTATGISAYTHKQAAVYREMVAVFVNDWYECLETKSLGSSWLKHYPSPPMIKRCRLVSNVRLYHPTFARPDTDLPTDTEFDQDTNTEFDQDTEDDENIISADIDLLEELMDA